MKSRWKYAKKSNSKINRLVDGQVSLIGEIHNLKLKYIPHTATSKTGETVVVLRLPKEATQLERIHSHSEAQNLADGLRTTLNRSYWNKKTRDITRKNELLELVD